MILITPVKLDQGESIMRGIKVEGDSRLNQLWFKYFISVIFCETYAHMNTLVGPLPGSWKGLILWRSPKLKFH